jgi:endonuclease/exonuclease/phosphatase family metal-dependent hydrolase
MKIFWEYRMKKRSINMKLMTLNIWGGHVYQPLMDFIQKQQNTDIFCLQEVYHRAKEKISLEDRPVSLDVFSELQQLLPNHRGYFRPVVDGIYGLATFVRSSIDILGEGDLWIYENPTYGGRGPAHSRILQWLECGLEGKIYSIINVHGLWNGQGKKDSPERLAQSRRIKEFLQTINTPKILCGDFNLRPDTASLALLEEDMFNLVKQYNVSSTRTSYYPKPEKFADYILVSPDIKVKDFKVLPHEVSDHAPLTLEIG